MRIIDESIVVKEFINPYIEKFDDYRDVKVVLQDLKMRILLMPTITTKQIKYFDEDEKVWKTGEVIVDE